VTCFFLLAKTYWARARKLLKLWGGLISSKYANVHETCFSTGLRTYPYYISFVYYTHAYWLWCSHEHLQPSIHVQVSLHLEWFNQLSTHVYICGGLRSLSISCSWSVCLPV
jgi:hypothetical protein